MAERSQHILDGTSARFLADQRFGISMAINGGTAAALRRKTLSREGQLHTKTLNGAASLKSHELLVLFFRKYKEGVMKRRYSGNDKHFGPFTFSKHNSESWRPLGI